MKFGKTFLAHQVPEWHLHYMNYKSLKKRIKAIHNNELELLSQNKNVDVLNNGRVKSDLAAFFFELDRNIEKVDDFYNKKYMEYEYRLKKITSALPAMTDLSISGQLTNTDSMTTLKDAGLVDDEEEEEIIGVLLELRNCFRNLKWFGELNKRAFRKILKKLDKKTGTHRQDAYLNTRVYPLEFCNDTDTVHCLSIANEYLTKLNDRLEGQDSESDESAEESTGNGVSNKGNKAMAVISANLANGSSVSIGSVSTSSSISAVDVGISLSHASASSGLPPPSSAFVANGMNSNRTEAKLNVTARTSRIGNSPYVNALKKDDPDLLNKVLIKECMSPVLAPLKLLLSLLNRATLDLSYKCIDYLLEIIPVLSDPADISGRNFLHHHVITLGKQYVKRLEQGSKVSIPVPAQSPAEFSYRLLNTFGPDGINSNDCSKGLLYVFEHLPAHLKFAILQKDNYKRTPLHYAAQYGLKEVTGIIVRYLKKWDLYNEKVSLDDVNQWGDCESLTPIHLAVLGTHPRTASVLLNSISPEISLTCPGLLHIATRLDSPELIELLLDRKGIDIDYCEPETHETSLYIASKLDLLSSVDCLLKRKANSEIGEGTFGWTPIFVAAAEGFAAIVESLIAKGAKFHIFDQSGWTPREHAALRGHMEIVKMLTPKDYDPYQFIRKPVISPKLSPKTISPYNMKELASSIDRLSDFDGKSAYDHNRKMEMKMQMVGERNGHKGMSTKEIKSFGHSYLHENQALVLLTLGSTDARDQGPSLDLKKVPLSKLHTTELDSALSLSIHTADPKQIPITLDLPLDDTRGSATDPITFKCDGSDPMDTVVYFDIVPTYQCEESPIDQPNGMIDNRGRSTYRRENYIRGRENIRSGSEKYDRRMLSNNSSNSGSSSSSKVLGRAVAILRNVYTSVGELKKSLVNVAKIPILEATTLEVLGTVKFEIMLVTSFQHPKMTFGDSGVYWKSMVAPRVIGHRGNGMNSPDRKSLQLGENTMESFIAAASLGASYVEFDVQLTKDNVPVVYHDFLVAESGIDIPMHALTLEQFLGLNEQNDNPEAQLNGRRGDTRDDTFISKGRIKGHTGIDAARERMRHTRTWKQKKYKGNSRGSTIASKFVTLAELFKQVPSKVGFNIEVKYPMLDESQIEDIGQVGPDMNHFVDTILKTVFENKGKRNVVFSSFHPDICTMLSLKQPSIPILFLTDSGCSSVADVRSSSLQNAIRFARKWNLLGIVSNAKPIVECPRLASVVKSSGLVCVTYGSENNDPTNVKLEITAGIDAIIADSVLAVRKELTKLGKGESDTTKENTAETEPLKSDKLITGTDKMQAIKMKTPILPSSNQAKD